MKEFLLNNIDSFESDFKQWVATDLYSKLEDNPHYAEQVVNFGCSSGIVTNLIYTRDIEKIYIAYFNDILDIYNEHKDSLKDNIEINATTLTWFAYEVVTQELLTEYQMEEA